ncbi:MAG TPA: glycosyltransferase, partial [Gemmatimonadaceae bacterium]
MTPDSLAAGIVWSGAAWWGYTYVGYPLALGALTLGRRRATIVDDRTEWPMVTICLVARNAGSTIAQTIERLLALDYPADRRHILIASDASSDATDDEIRAYAHRGVQLVRVDVRCGKTACENWASGQLRGQIVVNTDVDVVVDRNAIKRLVRAFDDPRVALASGRDVSIPPQSTAAPGTRSESSYIGYEMMLRALETDLGGIVGASGCLYAVRPDIQRTWLPGGLCRDFAAALIARRRGLRAVSVDDAVCYVPRSTDLGAEFRRKRRTCTRGLATLLYFGALLNPLRYGAFAWMLASHKLMRWLSPWVALPVVGAIAVLGMRSVPARIASVALLIGAAAGIAGYRVARGT